MPMDQPIISRACVIVGRRLIAGISALLVAAVLVVAAPGCGKKDEAAKVPKPAAPNAAAPAPSGPPKGVPARVSGPFSAAKDSPERAAQTLRRLAETMTDSAGVAAMIDPKQSSIAGQYIPGILMVYARGWSLSRLAEEKFGAAGAAAAASALQVYTVDLGNGLREMFEAERFEDVRRDGAQAYVMSNNADGQPMGAPLVFRDNQGDWLLLLCDGDVPWDDAKLGKFAAVLAGPMKNAPGVAASLDALADRLRKGEFTSADALAAALNQTLSAEIR